MTKTYVTNGRDLGGRVIILFLLFLVALYFLATAGLTPFAAICMLPAIAIFVYLAMKRQNTLFWYIFIMNYIVMGLQRYGYIPVPITVVTLLPQLLLLMSLVAFPRHGKNTMATPMLFAILLWAGYLVLQFFNETCSLPVNIGNWLTNIMFFSLYFLITYVIINKLINTPKNIMRFVRMWAVLSIIASYWTWRQQTFGWDNAENAWLMQGGMRTHIIGGSIRYFSFFSDAANFGCCLASSAVAFYAMALTTKLKKDKILFWIAAFCSTYSFFASGTRTALVCFIVGIFLYSILAKNVKLTVTVALAGALFVFIMAGTNIGDSNMQIRRMRSAFNPNDASKGVRDINKEALKKHLRDAPFGIGINIDEGSIPAFSKFRVVYETPCDSTYVFFWQRTGIVGVYVFSAMNIIMLLGGCYIVLFRLRNKTCKGIASGFCCGLLAINAGGYANHILLQYPNLVLFYGGMAIVYLLPAIEDDFTAYEEALFKEQEEKKRQKLEKKEQSRIKGWLS